MAWVETRITRTSQPQDAAGLSDAWVTRGLKVFSTPKQTARPGKVQPPLIATGSVPTVFGKSGAAWDLSATGNSVSFTEVDKHSTGAGAAGTIVVRFKWRNTAAWGTIFTQSISTFDAPYYEWVIGRFPNGSLRVMSGGGEVFPSGTKTLIDGQDYTLALTVGGWGGLGGAVFIEGVFAGKGETTTLNPSTRQPTLGTLPTDGGYEYNGQIYCAGIIDALCTYPELASLSANPYQLIEPEIVRIWVDDYVSAGGGATVIPIGVQATGSVGAPSATGSANATPAGVSTTASVGAPTATGGSSIAATALPAGVAASSAVGTPVATGAAVALPAGVSASSAVGVPVAIAGTSIPATVLPTGVQAFGAVGTPTVTAAAIAQPLGVAAIAYVGAPTIATGVSGVAVAYPAGVQAIGQVGTLIATGAAWTAAVGVQAVASVGTPNAYAGELVIYTPGAQTRPSRLQSSSRPSRLQTGTRASR